MAIAPRLSASVGINRDAIRVSIRNLLRVKVLYVNWLVPVPLPLADGVPFLIQVLLT